MEKSAHIWKKYVDMISIHRHERCCAAIGMLSPHCVLRANFPTTGGLLEMPGYAITAGALSWVWSHFCVQQWPLVCGRAE
jgi:hypothetical protein